MKKIFTLSTLAALTAASLSAQAQITVDGTLAPAEVGTGTGKYQLVGTYTGTHSATDRGLKALYMGTTATTLNIMVVASPESAGYSSLLLYLDAPHATGTAANTQLPVSDNTNSPLKERPTLDMSVDYGYRITVSPSTDANGGAMYLSKVDYTSPIPAAGAPDSGLGSGPKNGVAVNDTHNPGASSAFASTASVAANTSTGWEFEIPLTALGGAATGDLFRVMVAYLTDDNTFSSDVLPQITGQTTNLGTNPNFTTIPGKQFYTYQVGTGVLAARPASTTLAASAYPNPVAADSRLAYTVAGAAQPVTVTAYNSLGQPALTLLDGATQPAGDHQMALAPLQRLAAGVYLLQVRAGNQLSTQRVVVQ